jgi:hypothetical protein
MTASVQLTRNEHLTTTVSKKDITNRKIKIDALLSLFGGQMIKSNVNFF